MLNTLKVNQTPDKLVFYFSGELNIYNIAQYYKQIESLCFDAKTLEIDLNHVTFFDTASAIFIRQLQEKSFSSSILIANQKIAESLELVKNQDNVSIPLRQERKEKFLENFGKKVYDTFIDFRLFMEFFGKVFFSWLNYFRQIKSIRYKEIAFEINESAIKALGIIALTSFLIGVVVAYQSAYQLKI